MAGLFDDLIPGAKGDKTSDLSFTDLIDSGKKQSARAKADVDAKKRAASTPDQVRAVSKGFSFGFSDEMDAASAALETGAGNIFKRMAGKKPEYGMKDAYGAVMDAEKEASGKFSREHPVQNVGLQMAGGIAGPGMATGARYIAGARGLVGATARSAAVGATAGAVAGAGNADGGAADRARGAGRGAVEGAVIGGVLPGAGRVAQTAGRAVNAAAGQPFGGAARGAAARLREALQQDGLDQAQITAAVRQWQDSGVTPEFLNVVGENTRALIRAAGSQPGASRNAAQSYRDTTVASIPNRAIERTNTLTPGETRTPTQFADQTTAARDAAAPQMYRQPYAEPVQITPEIASALRGDTGRAAIQRARAAAAARRDDQQMQELDALLASNMNELPTVSAGTLDRVRIALGERARTASQRNANDMASGMRSRGADLEASLQDVPGMNRARTNYRARSEGADAALEGPSVMGPRSEFEAANAPGNNPFAQQGAQIRERQALRDNFGTRDQVRGRLADISDAPDVRPNLEQLYGERGGQFADAARNLVQKQDHANFIAPNTGSQTAPRGQDTRNAFSVAKDVMEALGGQLRPLVERLARGLTMTERERALLVQYGIGSPDDALRALNAPAAPASRMVGNAFNRAAVGVAPTAVGQTP